MGLGCPSMSSITDPSAGTIIKSDRSGRTRYTDQYKQEVLAAFETSSLSAPDFARQCGIKYPTFAAWIAARKRDGRQGTRGNTPAFLVAEVASSAHGPALEVCLPGGAVVRATDAEQIRLLAVLLRQLA
jgi:transposase-like protein